MAYSQQREILESAIRSAGGTDWLYEQIAGGVTISYLARKLHVVRSTLSKWLNTGERKKRLEAAQQEAAFAITEESQEIVDGIKPDEGVPMGDAIAKAKLQLEVRRDRAKVLNPAAFDRNASIATADNLGELLVGALTAVAKRHAPAQVPAATEPLEAEVVPPAQIPATTT